VITDCGEAPLGEDPQAVADAFDADAAAAAAAAGGAAPAAA
jgi:hypothetical protein